MGFTVATLRLHLTQLPLHTHKDIQTDKQTDKHKCNTHTHTHTHTHTRALRIQGYDVLGTESQSGSGALMSHSSRRTPLLTAAGLLFGHSDAGLPGLPCLCLQPCPHPL